MSEIKKSNEDIFLYEVHPKRVITGIPGIPAIRVRKSVYLTKDDVIKCLEKGSVYRRFSLKTERVTTANLDRVHREEYISEEDWPDFLVKLKAEGNGQVVDTTPETPNTEEDKIGTVQEVTVPEETVTTTEVKENTNIDSTETSEVDAENNSVETDEVSQAEVKSENEEETNNQEETATAVEETAAEQNTENKEKEKKETLKKEKNNMNKQQYYSKKNKK